jgi:phage terminase large subunit-like protein
MDPSEREIWAALLNAIKFTKLYRYKPYPFQARFHEAGRDNAERMLMAANRTGKTEGAANEVAMHMTGLYPAWWRGKTFAKGCLVWIGSVTNESSRDIVQKALLGGTGELLGTGTIPKDKIIGKPTLRQAGVSDVVDQFRVRHKTGEISLGIFKTYDQGWRKWQGTEPEVVWLDEEPDDYRIFTECQTRIMTSRGTLLVTFTPLLGETELVAHFTKPLDGVWWTGATWEDAPHLTAEDKCRLRASYPDYELDARTRGLPLLGEGRVFPIAEENVRIMPFRVPDWWTQVWGVDFGIDHPFAAALVAYDRDEDCLYVVACYRSKGTTPPVHAAAIRKRNDWAPIAWPHDGIDRDRASGRPLKDTYLSEGLQMLPISARYHHDKGGGQAVEPIVLELIERMTTGRFRVFDTCQEWLEEFRSYHRKDGRIVTVKDDVLKASFYAVMMKRYAMPRAVPISRPRITQPIIST